MLNQRKRVFLEGLLGCAVLSVLSLGPVETRAAAATSAKAGKDYRLIEPAQTVASPSGKQELIEFFWLGCPHCYSLEAPLAAWLKKQPADVFFRKVHVPFGNRYHHELAATLLVMGGKSASPEVFVEVFEAIHVRKLALVNDAETLPVLSSVGINTETFLQARKSFAVQTKIQQDKELTKAYRIDSVPAFAVGGKYFTAPSMVEGGRAQAFFQVLEYLLNLQRKRSVVSHRGAS